MTDQVCRPRSLPTKPLLAVAVLLFQLGAASAQSPPEGSDRAMADYFGNSLVLRDQGGKIIEIINYHPDRTLRQWRDAWGEGPWVVNNGQDSSTICKWPKTTGIPKVWCHAFAPNKHVGDHWVMPENEGGHPTSAGGIVVVHVANRWVIPNAPAGSAPPKEIFSLEKGLVLPGAAAP